MIKTNNISKYEFQKENFRLGDFIIATLAAIIITLSTITILLYFIAKMYVW